MSMKNSDCIAQCLDHPRHGVFHVVLIKVFGILNNKIIILKVVCFVFRHIIQFLLKTYFSLNSITSFQ